MEKAVFLDRDGVVNFESGRYTCNIDDFIINDGIGEAIKFLKDNDFLVIIISNQAGIAKKLYSSEDLLEMHVKLCMYLKEYGTNVDGFYFCPHHESISRCLCRKPDSLLFEKALAVYGIDPSRSFMIGDKERDIIAAGKCGIAGFIIEPNNSIYEICRSIVKQ